MQLDQREQARRPGATGRLLHNELPIDKYEEGFEVAGWLDLTSTWRLEARYLRIAYEGRGFARRDFIHDFQTYSAGEPIAAKAELVQASLGARVTLLDRAHVRLGIPFGLLWVSELVAVKKLDTGERGAGRNEAFSPYLGLWIDTPFVYGFGHETEMRFFGWIVGDRDFEYFELMTRVYVDLLDHARLFAGLRLTAFRYDVRGRNDRRMEGDAIGPFAGMSFYF